MAKHTEIHGFVQKDTQPISELKTEALVFEHVKSGARLIFLKNDDPNKVFCATFKTPPEDHSGCPHILEHSVLNGSRNFPSKSPFMELVKGSMQTFLNAMTGSDRTMYPVASTNDKDFFNLMEVYLDAVFFPNIYDKPETLAQEGWHHELLDPNEEIVYKGVVYNEMKGAFSSPDVLLFKLNQQMQFPDNAYGFESGGDPKHIPELTHDKFCAFHSKYYHPSNSRIYLYGDLDLEPALQMINDKYLSKFDRTQIDSKIEPQKPFKAVKRVSIPYPVDAEADTSSGRYFSMNYTYGDVLDAPTVVAMEAMIDILMDSPASPLKQVILASGMTSDSYAYVDHRALQPTISIICKDVSEENTPKLEMLILSELQRIVRDGIDKKLIEATINSKEFALREAQMQGFPKGLMYGMMINSTWLFDGDPFVYLRYEPLMENLRKGLSEPMFEQLIEKTILSNKHASIIVMSPEPGLNDKVDLEIAEELRQYKASLSDAQIRDLVAYNEKLIAWQNEPDKAEDLDKIPFISLGDINPKAETIPLEIEPWKEFTLLKHNIKTNGIIYLRTYFDLAHAEETDLPWIALYSYLAGKLNTDAYGYAELANEIDINTGGINLGLSLYNDYLDPDLVIAKLQLSGKALVSKAQELINLATEFALKPVFDDKSRIMQLIREQSSRLESSFMMAGHSVAVQRLLSPMSQYANWSDKTSGLGYYHFLQNLIQGFDTNTDQIVEELEWVRKTFFTQHKLAISLTSDEEGIQQTFEYLHPVIASISPEAYQPIEQIHTAKDFNEAIYAPVNVQFCAKGGNFFRKGYSYTGKLKVLKSILMNDFLYNEIRVKGGAYGIMSNFNTTGQMYFVSYRDPNLEQTLETFDKVAEYLRNFQCSPRELEKYIIGEISTLDYPNTPSAAASISDDHYFTGFTQQDKQQIRDEVLATKAEDIAGFADMIEDLMSKNHYCVFGNEARIRAAEKLFDKITPVFIGMNETKR